ncbi:hypothetical protein QJS10_CPB20g01538 [Acorus calamus]|uniref:CAF17 C-terminal domain-containing protein n=1 Tax=Acorus calamus TaxID=4465 RepID=A0AAV9C8I9_ACOCL|nr:hypothetical protein QJS10_CPB20g01538 [Acorus calamus]
MPPFKPYRTLSLLIRKPILTNHACLRFQHHHSLESSGPIACRLNSRSVIRFRGPDTVRFLQGLLSNDVRRFSDGPPGGADDATASLATPNLPLRSAHPLYTAMLTPQGRFLYDLFIYRPSRPDEKLDQTGSGPGPNLGEPVPLFADVDADVLDEILVCFKKYRLRSKVEIDNVAEEFSCWQQFGGKLSADSSSTEDPDASAVGWGKGIDHAGISATQGNDLGWRWFKDPRLASLGFRGIFPSNATPPLVESDKEMDEQYYLLWRLERGVAEGSTEIPKGEAIPLEYNLAGLNAISFDKGCYVGQESVARTHHRGVIRKRLLPLKFVNDRGEEMEQKVSPGSEVIEATSDKKVGTVTTTLGCRGMGLLRVEEAFKHSASLCIKGQQDVKVKTICPEWWPSEWTQDH